MILSPTALSFFHKFVIDVLHDLSASDSSFAVPESYLSCRQEIARPVSHGEQVYDEATGSTIIGKSITHLSAVKQVTGEAMYVDDLPKVHRELYAGIVGSSFAHAKIL